MQTSTAIPLTLQWATRCCSMATFHNVPLSAFLTEPSCYRTVNQPKLFWRKVVSKQKPRSEWRGWETSFKQALLLRAEGWRPSDRKCKHLTPLVGRFYAKTACQMLACSTIQVQLHSHLTKIIPTNGVKCASQLWGRRRRTRRR